MPARRIDRRRLLRLGACCAAGLAGLDAALIEPRWLEVTERDIPVPGLPASLRGLVIAQLSDLHLSSLGALHDRVAAEIRARDPALCVITGDAVEAKAALAPLQELCRSLAAPGREVLATIGNWEHWGEVPIADLRAAYARTGARLLANESMALPSGLAVTATDDACSGHADVGTALRDPARGAARLFLTHAPGLFDELPPGAPRFDLGLAGHTHGGQVTILGAATLWVPPGSGRFRAGAYDTAHGPVYVSRGVGTSVLPVRFTCRPELPFFRLVAG